MEEWHNIPGYEGYQASSEGRIRSLDREIEMRSRWGGLCIYPKKGKILKPYANQVSKYLYVTPGAAYGPVVVHGLVALAFHGARPFPNWDIMHLDEDKLNNRPRNLKYGTKSENNQRSWDAGSRVVHPNFIGARWRNHALLG
jgi:hypothetical protein